MFNQTMLPRPSFTTEPRPAIPLRRMLLRRMLILLGAVASALPLKLTAQSAFTRSDDRFIYHAAIDSADESCTAKSITIANRSDGAVIQTITPGENSHFCDIPSDQVFSIVDADFDGHNDIMLMQFLPASPNIPYYFWLYDPATGLFAEDSTLEEITSPEFDAATKTITSSWRSGCCDHGVSTYRYINGIPTMVEEYEQAAKLDHMEVTVRRLVKGKMKLISRKREKLERGE
jgi:hypothetical protein